ncbi:MAG: acyl-CoA dehydrogenase family protein, partial [Ilumatobacteraceae bacterium]
IVDFGTPEQQEQFVAKFLRAEEFCCQLFSEPEAGSDLAGLTTKAVRDGDEWVLDGQKVWSSGAHISTWGLAICRTDPDVAKHAGLTAFLVPIPHDGVEVRLIRQMNGGAGFNEVFLSGARIPDSLRIGAVGEGWKVALTVLGYERSSAGTSGKRGGSFDELLGLARAMGRTEDPVVRQALVKVYSKHRAREWARSRAAAAVRLGGKAGPEGSIGKLLWSNAMQDMSDVASMLLGAKLTADAGEWGTYEWNDHLLGAPGIESPEDRTRSSAASSTDESSGCPANRVDRDISFRELRSRKP